jgi:tRNA 5-methylaminomethyl-2-thiouridine biosynthesis bifunctional protein
MAGRSVCVTPARLERTPGGVPYAPGFQDSYHSAAGGLAQARHVFLAGTALPERWRGRDAFTILETGFGLGLNFLAAWDALRADPRGPARLHFVSVERHPFAAADLAEALAPFEELRPLATALVAIWPPPIAGFHRLQFDGGRVQLTLLAGDARELLPQLQARADALFSTVSRRRRTRDVVARGRSRARAPGGPGATLRTWTVAGGVRTALADAGFASRARRLRVQAGDARRRSRWRPGRARAGRASRRHRRRRSRRHPGRRRLASRGWEADLVDVRERRTGSTVGLVRPIANLRDAMNAQASRPLSCTHAALRALQHDGFHLWQRCGVLQLAAGR